MTESPKVARRCRGNRITTVCSRIPFRRSRSFMRPLLPGTLPGGRRRAGARNGGFFVRFRLGQLAFGLALVVEGASAELFVEIGGQVGLHRGVDEIEKA